MTDVIGRGDVDAPRRLRRQRPPRWLTWTVVALVVAGVAGVPAVRSKLADRSAAWLQEQWALRSPYDDARAAAIDAVGRRAGVADDAVVERASADADTAEANALEAITRRLKTHRTWAADVARARDAMVAALQLEVRMLRLDAASTHPTTGYLLAAPVDGLVRAASARMAAVARRRHLRPPPQVRVALPEERTYLRRLSTTTDIATGLSVVVTGPERPRVVDLDTGKLTALTVGAADGLGSWNGLTVVQKKHEVELFDAHAERTAVIHEGGAQLLSTTGSALWLQSVRGVRRFDATGRPLTRWLVPPDHLSPVAATGAVVVLLDPQRLDETALVWNTVTDARESLSIGCGWGTSTRTVVALPCPEQRVVVSVDVATGALHRMRLPGRVADPAAEITDPLSPRGDELAVVLQRSGVMYVGAVDLQTGRVRRSPFDPTLTPVAWSPRDDWLLLADIDSFNGGQRRRMALWRPADGRVTSVRMPQATLLGGGFQTLGLAESKG